MAPRPPESFSAFTERLKAAVSAGDTRICFGRNHFSHVVCRERDGTWTLRSWWLDPKKAQAYLEKHGTFMPEHAEMISEPGEVVIARASCVDEMLGVLKERWEALAG